GGGVGASAPTKAPTVQVVLLRASASRPLRGARGAEPARIPPTVQAVLLRGSASRPLRGARRAEPARIPPTVQAVLLRGSAPGTLLMPWPCSSRPSEMLRRDYCGAQRTRISVARVPGMIAVSRACSNHPWPSSAGALLVRQGRPLD